MKRPITRLKVIDVKVTNKVRTIWYLDTARDYQSVPKVVADNAHKLRCLDLGTRIIITCQEPDGKTFDLYFHFERGYATDWASIPRVARSLVEDDQWPLAIPSLVHDALNNTVFLPREQANDIFRQLIAWYGGAKWLQVVCWLGVESPKGRRLYRRRNAFDVSNSRFVHISRRNSR